ncbi:hypothetical protein [Mycobacterium leprae]|uniref:hypothetical protein n=1 Tax=Mycobacterium leprae TaxID=1769 RepID=UPI001E3B47E4|nr:hypothetical protein [Mycobacterium leprae]
MQRIEDGPAAGAVNVMEPEQSDKLMSWLDVADAASLLAAAARMPIRVSREC